MDAILFVVISILVLVFLCAVFRKFFLVPLFLGIGGLIWGLALLLDSLDNLNGLKNQITNFLNDEKYQDYLLLKNLGIILIVISSIFIILGLIFAIKSGKRKEVPKNSFYGAPEIACRGCGRLIPSQMSFCPHCGTPVFPAAFSPYGAQTGTAPGPQPVSVPGSQPETPCGAQPETPYNAQPETSCNAQPETPYDVQPENGARCPACGAAVKASARFCESCGTKL